MLAGGKGAALQIEAAGAAPLPSREDGAPLTPEDIGTALRDALAPHKVGKMKALVSIGRGNVELHRLSLPPASDAELPILVANQISREFSTAPEASIVDFVADNALPNQPRQVTAAVLSAEQHAYVRAVCAAAGLIPQRIVLRPYAAATLYLLSQVVKPASCLLMNVIDDEVDLTIIQDGRATFSRTVRFPQGAGESGSDPKPVVGDNDEPAAPMGARVWWATEGAPICWPSSNSSVCVAYPNGDVGSSAGAPASFKRYGVSTKPAMPARCCGCLPSDQ